MNPTFLVLIGPGFLNQVPTLNPKTLNPKPTHILTSNPSSLGLGSFGSNPYGTLIVSLKGAP